MVILIVDSRTNRYISYIVAGIDRQLYPTKNMIHRIEEFCHKKQRYFYILEMRIMNVIFIKIKEKSNRHVMIIYSTFLEYIKNTFGHSCWSKPSCWPQPRSCSPVPRSCSPVPRSCSPVPGSCSPVPGSCSPVPRSCSPQPRSCWFSSRCYCCCRWSSSKWCRCCCCFMKRRNEKILYNFLKRYVINKI